MPSDDLRGDAIELYMEHREKLITAGVIGVLLLFLLLLFGGFGAVGGIIFLGYALVWLAVLAFVLWLFYRLVTAVERIAAAQERMASARDHETVGNGTTEPETSDATGEAFTADVDDSTPGIDDETDDE